MKKVKDRIINTDWFIYHKYERVGMHIGVFGDVSTQFDGRVVADILEKIVSIISQYESHEQKYLQKNALHLKYVRM